MADALRGHEAPDQAKERFAPNEAAVHFGLQFHFVQVVSAFSPAKHLASTFLSTVVAALRTRMYSTTHIYAYASARRLAGLGLLATSCRLAA